MRLIFLTLVLFCTSCAYGPQVEKKSPLNYLNGENYETNPEGPSTALVIPAVKKREKPTQIKGSVSYNDGFVTIPLKNIHLGLYSEKGELITQTQSDLAGNFSFSDVIHNGRYEIRLLSNKYSAQHSLDVKNYLIENLILLAKKKRSESN